MGFSYNKAISLRPHKSRGFSTFLFVFLIALAAISPYAVMNKEFFAVAAERGYQQLGTFLLTPADLRGYFFPIFGSLGMVIGAPIALFFRLIPSVALPYVAAGAMALRVALCSLTAYIFIRRFTRTPEAARLGAMLYSLGSAVAVITVNNAYNNMLILFPLMLLAAEKLMTENRRMWLSVSVIATVLLSGYAAWSALIFLIGYCVIRMSSRDIKASVSRGACVFFEIIIGAATSAILLVPAFLAALTSTSLGSFIGIKTLFAEPEYILGAMRAFLIPAESANSPLLSAFTGGAYLPLLSLSGVIAYCGAKKYSAFKRIIIGSIVALAFPLISGLFSLGNPAEGEMWLFMPSLIFAVATAIALENREIKFAAGIKWSVALTVIFGAVMLAFPRLDGKNIAFGFYGAATGAGKIRLAIYLGVALLGLILTAILFKAADGRDKTLFNALTLGAAIFGGASLWLYIATEVRYFEKSLFYTFTDTNTALLSLDGVQADKAIYYSMLVSVAAFGALLVYLIICISTRKKRREAEFNYPEGEALMEMWTALDEEFGEAPVEEAEEFTLDTIAEQLGAEYPVNVDSAEFKGGFNIVMPEEIKK